MILIIKLHETRKKNEREKERVRIRERMHKPLHFLILHTSVISYHIDISSFEHAPLDSSQIKGEEGGV